AQVLKSRIRFGFRDIAFRNLLVVLQFSISIVLVIAAAVIFLQMRYARNLDLGFEREQVVVLIGSPTQGLTSQWETLRQELMSHSGIAGVTSSSIVPGMENPNGLSVKPEISSVERF